MKKIVILGAGISGLSCAWMLLRQNKDYEITVIEKESYAGGVCATFKYKDYLLDYGPHKFYSVIPGIMHEIKTLMPDELLEKEKVNSIYIFDSYLKYPLKMTQLALKMGFINIIGVIATILSDVLINKNRYKDISNYENYIISKFGRKLYNLVFKPLADKTWGSPETLSSDIAKTRIPASSFIDTLLRMLKIRKESGNTDAKTYLYPKKGFGRITDKMLEEVQKRGARVIFNAKINNFIIEDNKVKSIEISKDGGAHPAGAKGSIKISDIPANCENEVIPRQESEAFCGRDKKESISCDLLISSIPIESTLEYLKSGSSEIQKNKINNLKKLQHRMVYMVYLIVNKNNLTKDHWIFVPDTKFIFSRVFEQKNLSEDMIPGNKTVICCDFTDFSEGKYSKLKESEIADKCIEGLDKMGILKPAWVEESFVKKFYDFYPRYDVTYKEKASDIYNVIKNYDNIILTGRLGFYNYNNADHCIDMSRFIADSLSKNRSTKQIMEDLEKIVDDYRIID